VAAPSGTSTQTFLTYDLENNMWSKDVISSADNYSAIGAWPGGFAYGNYDNDGARPLLYDDARFTDDVSNSYHAEQRFKTPWIAPFGQAGEGSVNKLLMAMHCPSNVRLTVKVSTDEGSVQTGIWDIPYSGLPVTYRSMDIAQRRGTRYQVEGFTDGMSGISGTASGVSFFSLNFEVEPTGGIRRLASEEMR